MTDPVAIEPTPPFVTCLACRKRVRVWKGDVEQSLNSHTFGWNGVCEWRL